MVVFPDAGKAVLPGADRRLQGRRRDGSLPGRPGRQGRRQLRRLDRRRLRATTASTGRPGSRRTSPAAATSCSWAARPATARASREYNALTREPARHLQVHRPDAVPADQLGPDPDPDSCSPADIAKYPKIDVIVSDFGPTLVSSLPLFPKSGRDIPALATSDGNSLSCFWKDSQAEANPFKMITVATGNDNVRLAVDYAVAKATGGKIPTADSFKGPVFEDSVSKQPNPVQCKSDLPGDTYLSAQMPGDEQAQARQLTGTQPRTAPRSAGSAGPHRPRREFGGPRPREGHRDRDRPIRRRRRRRWRWPDISKHYAGVAALTDVSVERPARRGARDPRRERRRQVDADERRVRHRPARRAARSRFDGRAVSVADTRGAATTLGIAIVHQHPAVLPDLTVLENLQVALPGRVFAGRRTEREVAAAAARRGRPARSHLERPGRDADPGAEAPARDRQGLRGRVRSCWSSTSRPHRSAATPSRCSSDWSATLVAAGTSVVYITHRLAEVRELADRVTVLRDGRVRGTVRGSPTSPTTSCWR